MRVTAAALVTDAVALFRRDRALLLAVAGPFWFLPAYAIALLVPEPPRLVQTAEPQANAQALAGWLAQHGPWYLLDFAAALWGAATLYVIYCDRATPTVGEAIGRAAALWLRLLLASAVAGAALLPLALVFAALPGGLGAAPWTLATLYVIGRLLPMGPALAAERPLSAIGALRRGWALTRGSGLAMMTIGAATLGLGWLVGQPFQLLESWIRAQEGGNPVAVALVDAGTAAVAAAAALASALVAVAAYRRLAR